MAITWKDYLEKSKPADTDELMALDTTASANKRVKFSGIWDWIVDKMATAVMSKLETQNKTLIGAVNELNSNSRTIKTELNSSVKTNEIYSNGEIMNGFTQDRYLTMQFDISNGTGALQDVSILQIIFDRSGISVMARSSIDGSWKKLMDVQRDA